MKPVDADVLSVLSNYAWLHGGSQIDTAAPTPAPAPAHVCVDAATFAQRVLDVGSSGREVHTGCCAAAALTEQFDAQRDAMNRLQHVPKGVDLTALRDVVRAEQAPLQAFWAVTESVEASARAAVDVLRSMVRAAHSTQAQMAVVTAASVQATTADLDSKYAGKKATLNTQLDRITDTIRTIAAAASARAASVPDLRDELATLQALLKTDPGADALVFAEALLTALRAVLRTADAVRARTQAAHQGRSADTLAAELKSARENQKRIRSLLTDADALVTKLQDVPADESKLDMHAELLRARADHVNYRRMQAQNAARVKELTEASRQSALLPLLAELSASGGARAADALASLTAFVRSASNASLTHNCKVGTLREMAALSVRKAEAHVMQLTHVYVTSAARALQTSMQTLDSALAELQTTRQTQRAAGHRDIQALLRVLASTQAGKQSQQESMAHLSAAWQDLVRANTELVAQRARCLQGCVLADVVAAVHVDAAAPEP